MNRKPTAFPWGHGLPALAALAALAIQTHAALPRLKVCDQEPGKSRYLCTEDNKPFFWLGCTAWDINKLSTSDIDKYLADRAGKGYTLLQMDLLEKPASRGAAFESNDPRKPIEGYFKHVDYIISQAEKHGLYVGLVVGNGNHAIHLKPANAQYFGEWFGARHKDRTNIIWLMGGDEPPEEKGVDMWKALVAGLSQGYAGGDQGSILFTWHPRGGRSSSDYSYTRGASWLDFHMIESFQRGVNYDMISKDYGLSPVKPTVEGEAAYEGSPKGSRETVRRLAYSAVFAGALGYTYGHVSIFQFYSSDDDDPNTPRAGAKISWKQALDAPGSLDMRYVRPLFESRPMLMRVPDQSVIASNAGSGETRMQALRATDGSHILVYLPKADAVTVKLDKLSGAKVKAWWYDPRKGAAAAAGESDKADSKVFTPPGAGDWVLVLDNAARGFGAPGTVVSTGIQEPQRHGRSGSHKALGESYYSMGLDGGAAGPFRTLDGRSGKGVRTWGRFRFQGFHF